MVGITLSVEQAPPEVSQWLEYLIHRTVRDIRMNEDAALFALDRRGYSVVLAETQRNILSVWTRLIALQENERRGSADAVKPDKALPFTTSGAVPPSNGPNRQ